VTMQRCESRLKPCHLEDLHLAGGYHSRDCGLLCFKVHDTVNPFVSPTCPPSYPKCPPSSYIFPLALAFFLKLNIGGAPIASRGHTHPSHSVALTNLSPPIHFPFQRYPFPQLNLVCARLRHPPALTLSLTTPTPFIHLPP
jgi:hypothetical protein